jgi:hypothetical protein
MLEPRDVKGARFQVYLVPAKRDELGRPKAVSVRDHD